MNILAIDTSSTSGSIAVCKENKIVFVSFLDLQITHSERLMPQIDFGFKQSGITLDDIDLITITNGPGSFTGIRIGLSTAKGFCFGKKIPLLPVNTLEILAFNVYGSCLPILSMIDAKMDEVYAALYSPEMEILIPPQNCKPADFLDKIKEKVIIVGDGAVKYRETISNSGTDCIFAQPHQNIVLASALISYALKNKTIPKYDFDFIADLEPYYLRKSQAELAKMKAEDR